MWKSIKGYLVRSKANEIRKALRGMETCGDDLDSPLWGVYMRRQKKEVMDTEVVYEPTLFITVEAHRKAAYWLAEKDGFAKPPEHYWHSANDYLSSNGLSPTTAKVIGYIP